MSEIKIIPEKGTSALDKLAEEIDSDPVFQHVVNPKKNGEGSKTDDENKLRKLRFGKSDLAERLVRGIVAEIGGEHDSFRVHAGKILYDDRSTHSVPSTPVACMALALADAALGLHDAARNLVNDLVSEYGCIAESDGSEGCLLRDATSAGKKLDIVLTSTNGMLSLVYNIIGEHDRAERVRKSMLDARVMLELSGKVRGIAERVTRTARGKWNVLDGEDIEHSLAVMGIMFANIHHEDVLSRMITYLTEQDRVVICGSGEYVRRLNPVHCVNLTGTAGLALMRALQGTTNDARELLKAIPIYGELVGVNQGRGVLLRENQGSDPSCGVKMYATVTNALYAAALCAQAAREPGTDEEVIVA